MKLPIRRVMAETHIKRIKKELEELDALEARAKHEPAGQRDETYLLMNYDEQRKKLLKELEKQQKIVDQAAAEKK
ncbi:MAG: hypothetical protein BWY59_00564 [Verrucomicrobia bacterium ADurb.Bin345]|nr:MAG: hypothetical protein BWY59_00564 [Verrucomicrobia bacterium ADurb.Bin345]